MTLLLIHGAANSAGVWVLWQRELEARGLRTEAVDLPGHGSRVGTSLSKVSMDDYATDVVRMATSLEERPVVMGWSMGGLVALMVAAGGAARACIALAPSMPARQVDASLPLREGEFGPDEYGIVNADPADQPSMPDLNMEERAIALASLSRESRYARDERARGIVIESLPCPLLLVTGEADTQWPAERYRELWLPAERLVAPGASHWGLVLSGRTLGMLASTIIEWVERTPG